MRTPPLTDRRRLSALMRQLEAAGEPFVLATVVRRRPPVSAQMGDKAIVTRDGRLIGWVGGRCSEALVREEALRALADGRPRLLRLQPEPEETDQSSLADVRTVVISCPSGGEVEVYLEPYTARPRLVAVGGTPLVRALGLLAPIVGFDTLLVTGEGGEEMPVPDDAERLDLAQFLQREFTANTFFVIASAGRHDEEALQKALASGSSYVALVASRRRAEAVRAVLRTGGVPEEAIRRIRTPAGLDIGAKTQEEIALSVLAEVVAAYRQGEGRADLAPVPTSPPSARDPVCGMAVGTVDHRWSALYEGETYFFCSAHCRQVFLKDPAAYLGAGGRATG